MRARTIFPIAAALVLGGCSLLVDTDRYQPLGDGGVVDPGAPSAPVVRIDPESPVTTDELVMTIVTESVDPLGAGDVSYRIEWLRDGEAASVTGATVPAAMTAKAQTWTVRVIPTSADGTRTGAAGTASVTIGNLTPVASYVGLSDYRPIAGAVLEGLTGPLADPDGDLTRVVYTWLRDGTPIAGASGPRITLDAASPAGSRISLRVTPRDADDADGASIETGEAIVREDVVRWRQLAPDRWLRRGGSVFYDAPNRRMVVIYRIGRAPPYTVHAWEYAMEPTGARWVELHPAGDPPEALGWSVVDTANHRILFFGSFEDGGVSGRIFAFDMSVRGAEAWSELTPSGEPPVPRAWPSLGYDAERRQVIFAGGALESGPVSDLHLLDVARPGFEAWRRIDAGGASFAAATVIVDEARDRALFVGGVDFVGPALLNTIYALDLADPSGGIVLTGSTLPTAFYFGTSIVDAERDRALIGLGGTMLSGDPSAAFLAIDLETLAVSALAPTGTPATAGFLGHMAFDPYTQGRIVMYPGPPAFDGSGSTPRFDVYEADAATLEFRPIHRYDVDAPPALDGAIGSGSYSDLIFFGGQTDYRATDGAWRLDPLLGWARIATRPDAISGRSPAARHGVVASELGFRGLSFFGGVDNATFVDPATWSLSLTRDDEGEWIERALIAGASPPAPREGAMMFDPQCYRREVGFFGGRAGGGSSTGETWLLDCDSTDPRRCSWERLIVTSPEPGARSYGTIVRNDRELVLFGGRSDADGSPLAELWELRPCDAGSDPAGWSRITPSGAGPSGRFAHSMVRQGSGTAVGVARWLVIGGTVDPLREGGETNETWILEHASGTYRWERLAVPSGSDDSVLSPRSGHVVAWDGDGRRTRLLLYGGVSGYFTHSDLWELRFPAP